MMETLKYGSFDVTLYYEGEYVADETPMVTIYYFGEGGEYVGEQDMTICVPQDSAGRYGSGNAYLCPDLPREMVRCLEEHDIISYAGHTAINNNGCHFHLYHLNMEKIMEMTHALEASAVA